MQVTAAPDGPAVASEWVCSASVGVRRPTRLEQRAHRARALGALTARAHVRRLRKGVLAPGPAGDPRQNTHR